MSWTDYPDDALAYEVPFTMPDGEEESLYLRAIAPNEAAARFCIRVHAIRALTQAGIENPWPGEE